MSREPLWETLATGDTLSTTSTSAPSTASARTTRAQRPVGLQEHEMHCRTPQGRRRSVPGHRSGRELLPFRAPHSGGPAGPISGSANGPPYGSDGGRSATASARASTA